MESAAALAAALALTPPWFTKSSCSPSNPRHRSSRRTLSQTLLPTRLRILRRTPLLSRKTDRSLPGIRRRQAQGAIGGGTHVRKLAGGHARLICKHANIEPFETRHSRVFRPRNVYHG